MAAMMVLILVLSLAGGFGGHMGTPGPHQPSESTSRPHEENVPKSNSNQLPQSRENDGTKLG